MKVGRGTLFGLLLFGAFVTCQQAQAARMIYVFDGGERSAFVAVTNHYVRGTSTVEPVFCNLGGLRCDGAVLSQFEPSGARVGIWATLPTGGSTSSGVGFANGDLSKAGTYTDPSDMYRLTVIELADSDVIYILDGGERSAFVAVTDHYVRGTSMVDPVFCNLGGSRCDGAVLSQFEPSGARVGIWATLPTGGSTSSGVGFANADLSKAGTYTDSSDMYRLTVIGSVSATAVPEPNVWALLLVGFGVVGSVMRAQRRPAGSTHHHWLGS